MVGAPRSVYISYPQHSYKTCIIPQQRFLSKHIQRAYISNLHTFLSKQHTFLSIQSNLHVKRWVCIKSKSPSTGNFTTATCKLMIMAMRRCYQPLQIGRDITWCAVTLGPAAVARPSLTGAGCFSRNNRQTSFPQLCLVCGGIEHLPQTSFLKTSFARTSFPQTSFPLVICLVRGGISPRMQ
jgi:hypothetical protein